MDDIDVVDVDGPIIPKLLKRQRLQYHFLLVVAVVLEDILYEYNIRSIQRKEGRKEGR
jgi:hypothetical protein